MLLGSIHAYKLILLVSSNDAYSYSSSSDVLIDH